MALHRVFNSPVDKIVFDVSHQAYPHKMLTGRMEAYLDEDKYDAISGYSEPSESPHDHFVIGHTSTSVSLACGLAKARDLKGEKYNVIAGGFGEKVARVAAAHGLKVLVKGAPKKFEDRFDPQDLLVRVGLTVDEIVADVLVHC